MAQEQFYTYLGPTVVQNSIVPRELSTLSSTYTQDPENVLKPLVDMSLLGSKL